MTDLGLIGALILVAALVAIFASTILDTWAWLKQREIAKIPDAPSSLKDRVQVSKWLALSSFFLMMLGLRFIFSVELDYTVVLAAFTLAFGAKAVPSARWLWWYYRGKFDGASPDRVAG